VVGAQSVPEWKKNMNIIVNEYTIIFSCVVCVLEKKAK
jgi:hypothetical protein